MDLASQKKLIQLEKGLKSTDVSLVTSALFNYSNALKSFSSNLIALTSGILKLCQVFRDTNDNNVRYLIWRVFCKSKHFIVNTYSIDEVCLRLFGVLESTDPVARRFSLRALFLFAPRLDCQFSLFQKMIDILRAADNGEEKEIVVMMSIKFCQLNFDSFSPFLFNWISTLDSLDKFSIKIIPFISGGPSVSFSLYQKCKKSFDFEDDCQIKVNLLKCMFSHAFHIEPIRKDFFHCCIRELQSFKYYSSRQISILFLLLSNMSKFFVNYELEKESFLQELLKNNELIPRLVYFSVRFNLKFYNVIFNACFVDRTVDLYSEILINVIKSIHLVPSVSLLEDCIANFIESSQYLALNDKDKKQLICCIFQVKDYFSSSFFCHFMSKIITFSSKRDQYYIFKIINALPNNLKLTISHNLNEAPLILPLYLVLDRKIDNFSVENSECFYSLLMECIQSIRLGFYQQVSCVISEFLIPKLENSYFSHYFDFLNYLCQAIPAKNVNILYQSYASLKVIKKYYLLTLEILSIKQSIISKSLQSYFEFYRRICSSTTNKLFI